MTARKVGDFAYLVASKSAWYAAPRASVPFYRDETFDDGFAIDVDDGGSYAEAAGAAGDAVAVCACGDVQYVTAVKTALDDFTVVVAVDVSDVAAAKSAPSTKTVLANRAADSAVYCSKENLYLAQTEWAEGDGATYYRTAIVRLALDGADVAYAASYAAPGTLLNQFSLSESALDGTLRVATTSREGSWADTYNNVYVFDESGARLGAVVGLAPGESIKSARFTATRGYLVTFVQTDPLFTISLDDPANPYVMGELKIPGYSAYLHPINASHMLGVGRAADEKTGVERRLADVVVGEREDVRAAAEGPRHVRARVVRVAVGAPVVVGVVVDGVEEARVVVRHVRDGPEHLVVEREALEVGEPRRPLARRGPVVVRARAPRGEARERRG